MFNQVRIIGGHWRGRKILFPNLTALRPTSNRIRETLFNWLMPTIRGANCLDMFAGSGSLAFEALSRGAASIEMWEPNSKVREALLDNASRLQASHFKIQAIQFPQGLPKFHQPFFDIIFLDPPFHQGYIKVACSWLAKSNCLNQNALVYIEMESQSSLPQMPEGWAILKAKKAGDVNYYLVRADRPLA